MEPDTPYPKMFVYIFFSLKGIPSKLQLYEEKRKAMGVPRRRLLASALIVLFLLLAFSGLFLLLIYMDVTYLSGVYMSLLDNSNKSILRARVSLNFFVKKKN